MSRRKPRVAVLYNAPTLPPNHPDYASEASVVATARAISQTLKTQGFKAWPMAAKPPVERLVRSLINRAPDLVFNLIEGFGGHSGGEARITSLLELMRIPFTGCPPEAQSLCRQKGRTKAMLVGLNLPTARFWTVGCDDPLPDCWPGRVLVKPESEDASLGIDQTSVVDNPSDLADRVLKVRTAYGSRVLIEAYLPGREFNVGVIALPDPQALAVSEILYQPNPGHWPILTYAAKWDVGSAEDLASRPGCPAKIDADLETRLKTIAEAVFRLAGCRDYARVDFRLDDQGNPMILEINPNPDLDPSAGVARSLAASGLEWSEIVGRMARLAIARGVVHA